MKSKFQKSQRDESKFQKSQRNISQIKFSKSQRDSNLREMKASSRNLREMKASVKAELLQLKLIHLFARELFLMKTFEIEQTKTTFITSILKVECQGVLVSSISNFFINKMSLANKWMSKKIPSFCNLALMNVQYTSNLAIRNVLIRNLFVLRNHFL